MKALYSTLAALLASGVYWQIAREPLAMKIHGAAAMAFLVLLGALLAVHVPVGWAERRGRASGIAMLAACGLLTVTGYLLYYTGNESARALSSHLHLALGLALPIVLGVHLALKSSRQPAALPAASQPPSDDKELAEWKPPSGT